MVLRIIINLVTLSFIATSCNMTFEIGLEKIPTAAPAKLVATPAQTESPIPAATETSPVITAAQPTPSAASPTPTQEAPTSSPAPTPLPGVEVIPLSSLGTDIPWLPLDKTRWPCVQVVTFNTQLPPFNNHLVRQAFAASIDKEAIVEMAKQYYEVDSTPATTFIHPQILGRNLYGVVGINFDPVRAKELLAQAGYQDASSFPAVRFIVNFYPDTVPGARFNMAKAMADMWRTYLGVTVNVEAYQPDKFWGLLSSNPPELFWVGWLPATDNDPNVINLYYSNHELNYGHYSNLDFDSLVNRAAAIHDPATRQGLYIEAERILCESEPAIIPLYHTFANLP
jgi:ABC-type transport system substrate-binding protein